MNKCSEFSVQTLYFLLLQANICSDLHNTLEDVLKDWVNLLSQRARNIACMRYHLERAKSIAGNSAFTAVSYTCEYFVEKVAWEERLARHYRALIKLSDRALLMLTPNERTVIKWRYVLEGSAEGYVLRYGTSLRTYFRRLAIASCAFNRAVAHLKKVHTLTSQNI